MKIIDLKNALSDFWKEFRKVKSGIFGLFLFALFLILIIFEPALLQFPEANNRWRDISYWENNPKSAPPEWTNFFSSKKSSTSSVLESPEEKDSNMGGLRMKEYTFIYNYDFDLPPQDIIFMAEGNGDPMVLLSFTRPDGESIDLIQKNYTLGDAGRLRISTEKDSKLEAIDFASGYEEYSVTDKLDPSLVNPNEILFSKAEKGMIKSKIPLKGEYILKATVIMQNENDIVKNGKLIITGRVFGVLGTDSYKRDLWTGVLAGIKWALLIGILTAIISVSLGVVYGVISAYLGGFWDTVMMRIFEIFVSVPLLPVLIVMSAVFKPSIWTLILMMCIFFWVGPVRTVRSMAMQIREETYIEASRALGASHARIIFKHMIPLLIPYSFASMAIYIPGAIVYEATVSLLGLGDANIVTWGQILSDALNSGAVLNGIWWWVVPPGLSIALMGMAFAFIGFAMDKILHPKLRTR